mmetsp:Transcript_17139/g.23665  ORF Transcript_17139/g.23665 Transcript_17139/m.23665 type:complete len:96 (-) Transcript_17139:325-612(-)
MEICCMLQASETLESYLGAFLLVERLRLLIHQKSIGQLPQKKKRESRKLADLFEVFLQNLTDSVFGLQMSQTPSKANVNSPPRDCACPGRLVTVF